MSEHQKQVHGSGYEQHVQQAQSTGTSADNIPYEKKVEGGKKGGSVSGKGQSTTTSGGQQEGSSSQQGSGSSSS